MRNLIFSFLALSYFNIAAQTGHILVIANTNSIVLVDGKELGSLQSNKPMKFDVSVGEHYLQVITSVSKAEKNEIIIVEEGVQKVLKYEFNDAQTSLKEKNTHQIQLAKLSINIPGGLIALIGDYETSGVPIFYYHLLKGDQLVIDFNMINKKGTNIIEVSSYPDGNRVFSNNAFQNLKNSIVNIPADGIYRISFTTNHAFDRTAQLTFKRIPSSKETINHATKVIKKRRYEVVSIQEPSDQWVNSKTSLTGTTRITIPVNLPSNTVEWFYIVSASRRKEDIQANLKNTSLVKDLSKALLGVSSAAMVLNLGLDLITRPPGSDYCDVFLIDHDNYRNFLSKLQFTQYTEGTRTNITSARVKVTGSTQGQYYLGIRNNDLSNGIDVGIEVAAIVYEDYYGKED